MELYVPTKVFSVDEYFYEVALSNKSEVKQRYYFFVGLPL